MSAPTGEPLSPATYLTSTAREATWSTNGADGSTMSTPVKLQPSGPTPAGLSPHPTTSRFVPPFSGSVGRR